MSQTGGRGGYPVPSRRPHHAPYRPAPRRPEPAGPNPMRIAGVLFLVSAVIAVVEHELLSKWIHVDSNATQAYTHAGMACLLGVALFQGSSGAKKCVLWLSGLGALALIGGLAVAAVAEPSVAEPLALIGLLGIVGVTGIFGLLVGDSPGRGRIVASAIAMLVASVGGLGAELWLLKAPERWLREQIQADATSERLFRDDEAGISVNVPTGWVILAEDSALVPAESARVALGETEVGAVALLFEEDGTDFISLDHYLDHLMALRQESLESLEETLRTPVTIDKAAGRKAFFQWTVDGRHFEGFSTAWQDGETLFSFSGWTTQSLAGAAEERFSALEQAVAFEAPVATYVAETVARVTAACSFLSRSAVQTMLESMPRDASPGRYFRKGYEWASKGASLLPPEDAGELGEIMGRIFGAVSSRDRRILTGYIERARLGRATTASEDSRMNDLMGRAILALPEAEQTRLRSLIAVAISSGRLL